jgi:hypothetical protein
MTGACAVKPIDLDELERRARGSTLPLRNEGDGVLFASPKVVLALIARIREMEIVLLRCGQAFAGFEQPPTPQELIVLLEKGAVLP